MLSERFSRHFNCLNIDLFADGTITSIFSRIVLWHLDTKGMCLLKMENEYSPLLIPFTRLGYETK